MDYKKLLEHSYAVEVGEDPELTRLEYLSRHIFDFVTYDGEMDKTFAKKAVEVCDAVTNKTTFDYIKDERNYEWYLLMCNMPFFAGRLNWGTSIRGAWWSADGERSSIHSCGLWEEDRQLTDVRLSCDEWPAFIQAIVDFSLVKT